MSGSYVRYCFYFSKCSPIVESLSFSWSDCCTRLDSPLSVSLHGGTGGGDGTARNWKEKEKNIQPYYIWGRRMETKETDTDRRKKEGKDGGKIRFRASLLWLRWEEKKNFFKNIFVREAEDQLFFGCYFPSLIRKLLARAIFNFLPLARQKTLNKSAIWHERREAQWLIWQFLLATFEDYARRQLLRHLFLWARVIGKHKVFFFPRYYVLRGRLPFFFTV